jgi:hypothetical protein
VISGSDCGRNGMRKFKSLVMTGPYRAKDAEGHDCKKSGADGDAPAALLSP